jgi:hypothetical protein
VIWSHLSVPPPSTVASWPTQAAQTMPTRGRSDPGPATAPQGPAGSGGATIAGEPGRPGGPGPSPAGPGTGPAAARRWLAAGVAVAVVVVVYLVVAAVAHAFPFAKPAHPIVAPTPPVTPIHQSTPATTPVSTPASTPASSIAPLAQLLPSDIPVSSCFNDNPANYNFTIVGATKVYDCQSGNWQVTAFQMDSSAHYMTTLQNFNSWIAFNPSAVGTNCPPLGNSPGGSVPWSNKYFPQQSGQTLECWTYYSGGSPFPSYAWGFPSENAFLWATGNAGTSWPQLNTWWQANETQAAAPTS